MLLESGGGKLLPESMSDHLTPSSHTEHPEDKTLGAGTTNLLWPLQFFQLIVSGTDKNLVARFLPLPGTVRLGELAFRKVFITS